MTDRSSSAYLTSVLLHAGGVVVILLLAYTFASMRPETPKTFELVAGEGEKYGATAAPALGSADGIKLATPAVPVSAPAPAPEPTPPAPAVAETVAAPVPAPRPVPVKTPAKPAPAKPVDRNSLPEKMRRAEMRAAVAQAAKDEKAADAAKRQITEAEFRKEHAKANAVGISGGVVGGSIENKTGGAGGKALTREEGSLLDAYFALLISHLKENFESAKPTDVSDKLTAKAGFYVSADGSILRVRILTSSGNDEFDQAVLEAVRHTHSIGPRPDHNGDEVSVPFSMHDDTAP